MLKSTVFVEGDDTCGALNIVVGRGVDITSIFGPAAFRAGAADESAVVARAGEVLPPAATAGTRPSAEITAIDPNKRVAFFMSFLPELRPSGLSLENVVR